MPKHTYFIPGVLCGTVNAKTDSGESVIPLHWAKGMIGALPVFLTREDAEVYAKENGGAQITEIESAS